MPGKNCKWHRARGKNSRSKGPPDWRRQSAQSSQINTGIIERRGLLLVPMRQPTALISGGWLAQPTRTISANAVDKNCLIPSLPFSKFFDAKHLAPV
jgi:hypothetical protein